MIKKAKTQTEIYVSKKVAHLVVSNNFKADNNEHEKNI